MKTAGLLFWMCLALASSVVAAPHHQGVEHDPGLHFLEVMADRLGFSAAQEERIGAMLNDARLDNAVDRERIAQLRQALHALSQDPNTFDEGAARELADELAQVVARMAVAGAELRWKVHQQLTDEQREQVREWRDARPPHPPTRPFWNPLDP